MNHTYLSQEEIDKALKNRHITSNEADVLKKKINIQTAINKSINKQ